MLDDLTKMKEIDPTGQIEVLEKWPELIKEAYELGKAVVISDSGNYESLIVTGMGGSAISGEFLVSWLEGKIDIPVIANKKYDLPVYKNSLVICISYSGNTEETISALNQALSKTSVAIITSNGAFENIANKKGLPLVKLPKGYQPRYAFPLIFFALTGLLERNGFIPSVEEEINGTIASLVNKLHEWDKDCPEDSNSAKKMAKKLLGTTPVIISSHSSLGHRIKGQINENAKMICFYDVLPEMFHNTIVGWESDRLNEFQIIRIKLGSDLPKLHDKFDSVIKESAYKGEVLDIEFSSGSLLTDLMLTVTFTDFVTTYLAVLNGKNPARVPQIELLKEKFASEQARELDKLESIHLAD
ncbi:MAG: bifunctional phosphoglucose/phosphomannose isomerase [Candidatus Hodarchaeales archaeon]